MSGSIPKPADSVWTDEQWEAISARGRNMLVAAAAGSGKTAVLVERIIRRVTAETDPIDVDQLLVATFTNAAAAEMRQRIREALEKEWFKNPDSERLRKQLMLVGRASITTLHSFCLEAVRRHFQAIPLDPGFRIANETEAELMRQDVLDELFEDYYEQSEEDSSFWRLLDWFGGERNDAGLYRLVLRLFDFSRSHPWPERWLDRMAGRFETGGPDGNGEPPGAPWFDSLLRDAAIELEGAAALLAEAVRQAGLPGGPQPYLERLADDLAQVDSLRGLASGSDWAALHEAFQTLEFGKLKPCRGDGYDAALQESVKSLRDQVKKQMKEMQEQLFRRSPTDYLNELNEMAPLMRKLVELTGSFAERYTKAKAAKGLVDFADLEHYCLKVLLAPDSSPNELKPSAAALEYRERFAEVLLDEYQDTNRVQEAIVELLSRSDPGNRFMVGDVKQSIYRFRLADPGLFLEKYRMYGRSEGGQAEEAGEDRSGPDGLRIDLARNFRSRREIVDGVNYIFKQIMHRQAAEIDYDRSAELVFGASVYPEEEVRRGGVSGEHVNADGMAIEWTLIDRSDSAEGEPASDSDAPDGEDSATESAGDDGGESEDARDAETAQLEARVIAGKIRGIMGMEHGSAAPSGRMRVFDKSSGGMRPLAFRDIVILLRATRHWSPILMEELRQAGIPAYADLNTGYFSATEVEVALSLLRVIDNPYQDIPLAGVLRSPVVRLSAEQLAQIRVGRRQGSYYEAALAYAGSPGEGNPELRQKLRAFLETLERWRTEARQGSLSGLIWRIFRETGYYDLVGGLPGGNQRQANLRALYDRARQYESTSLRGLFRFLRFIERLRDSGGDLGTARALGEQEDVVRILSIHKSKGLEFPVVFVAGLAKPFNLMDINGSFLLHKELGFGPKFIDTRLRLSYPSLPALAMKRRMRMESLAEEMRILYVALTRAKEKLYLLGSVAQPQKQTLKWARQADSREWSLPAFALIQARSFLDWLGPALIRHPDLERFRSRYLPAEQAVSPLMRSDPSRWRMEVMPQAGLVAMSEAAAARAVLDRHRLEQLARMEPVGTALPESAAGAAVSHAEEIARRLHWTYPNLSATQMFSKTSVSEMKRMSRIQLQRREQDGEEPEAEPLWQGGQDAPRPSLIRRPRFMEQHQMTAAERGTVYHAIMQHLPLAADLSPERVRQTAERLKEREMITAEQLEAIDPAFVFSFFESDPGIRMLRSPMVRREVPFSYGLTAGEAYPGADRQTAGETVLVQGVIDCIFAEEDGLVLVDYKTDAIYAGKLERSVDRYRLQIELYAKAVESIWKRPVKEKVLYFFDGAHVVVL